MQLALEFMNELYEDELLSIGSLFNYLRSPGSRRDWRDAYFSE
jgi:hypothetical protein